MSHSAVMLNITPRVFTPQYSFDDTDREMIAEMLSEITVQTYRTLIRSQVVRWNVVGSTFGSIHALTEQHYSDLFAAIDLLAERIRILGFPAPTGKAASGLDRAMALGSRMTVWSMVEELVDDHEQLVRLIRESTAAANDVGDVVSYDLLADRLAFHQKAIETLKAVVAD